MVRWSPVVVVMLGAVAGGCTKRNPDVCCSSAPECAEIGFDDITPCEDLRVCVNSMCVNPQCTTSAECSDPTPYCVGQICAAACTADLDCAGAPGGAFCAPDGSCVACLDSTACTDPAAGVCDDTTHSCRACTDDDECGSGICLAAEGVCAGEQDVVFVSMAGTDSGECTSAAPCLTTSYALTKITPARQVLRIVSLDYITSSGVVLDRDVYLDADDVRIQRSTPGPVLTTQGQATVTIEGVRISAPTSSPALAVLDGSITTALRLDLDFQGIAEVQVSSGAAELHLVASHLRSTPITCDTNATIEIQTSLFEQGSTISATTCDVSVSRTMFDGAFEPMITASTTAASGSVSIENSIFVVSSSSEGRFFDLSATTAEKVLARFNTFVDTTTTTTATDVFICTGPIAVSSSVAAGPSSSPVSGGCVVDHTLFDSRAGVIPGQGNATQDTAAMFVDLTNRDYHPSSGSPALGGSDPTQLVPEDYTGATRPMPAGSVADAGALEVP